MTKKPKLISSIRAKLVSAVAMLLVAMIMVVSSTYAWFTLSTAPEVTGISTQIGANGALEMALLPLSGKGEDITSAAGDGMLTDDVKKNVTWGNLVKLNDTAYGLDKITLYPSVLNVSEDGVISGSPLGIPAYGADGRVSELVTNKTVLGPYNGSAFYEKDEYGVRGVGAASGLTDRQLSYRDAKGLAGTATAKATTTAATALNTKGSALANIAIEHGMGGTESYDKTDVEALRYLIDETKKSLTYIEKAYMYYIAAYFASAEAQEDVTDEQAKAIYDTVNADGKTLADLETILTGNNVTLPTEISDKTSKLKASQSAVKTAEEELVKLEEALKTNPDTTFVWAGGTVTTYKTDASGNYVAADGSVLYYKVGEEYYAAADCDVSDGVATPKTDATAKTEANMTDRVVDSSAAKLGISGAMTPLAKTEAMLVNGYKVSEVKANLGDLVSSVTAKGGLVVTMETGAGVFADIADHCGDYTASVTIDRVEYNGIVLNNMKARMETETKVELYLPAIGVVVNNAGQPEGTGTVMPISEFYGYVIDMAFRTNATESNLLLQTEAADRIYKDKTENNDQTDQNNTWGHGSTMTFAAVDNKNFSIDQVKALMENLRIVFFNPNTEKDEAKGLGTVYVYAKLDMDNAGMNENSEVVAPLVLYKVETSTTYKTDASGNYLAADDSVLYYYNSDDQKFYNGSDFENASVVEEASMTGRVVVSSSKIETILTGKDAVITPLIQNTVAKVSALVYLDGKDVGNDDVAATVAQSMTGKLNLQFASSANLVPMEYADLHPQSSTTNP